MTFALTNTGAPPTEIQAGEDLPCEACGIKQKYAQIARFCAICERYLCGECLQQAPGRDCAARCGETNPIATRYARFERRG